MPPGRCLRAPARREDIRPARTPLAARRVTKKFLSKGEVQTMAATTDGQKFRVIGTRPIRHDGIEKVTGAAKYGADYSFPGMLHGKVLRSPHAHALIKSIKVDKALALPGVKAIVTSADLPELADRIEQGGEIPVNMAHVSLNILARRKVLYDGHAVAAVAATSPHIAEEALKLIEVEYEPLPAVMKIEEAMKPGAPILLPNLRNKDDGPDKQTNVANHLQFKRGDVEAGFKSADYVVEREYHTSMVHQGYIEPHAAVGIYNPDGHATIYCSTQGTFVVRSMSAGVLGMQESSIKVVPAEIGGGFGGKTTIYLEPLSVLLSKKTGHPVKLVMSRGEVLRASGPTSGGTLRCKMGATKDGKIVAAQVWMAYEAGAFPGSPVGAGAMCIVAPYNIPNILIDAYDVVVNRPKTAAYRAPGATNAAMASETVIDELAEKCKIDPCDMRLMNGAQEGTAQTAGPPYKRIGYIETIQAIKNSPHYKSKLEGPNRGRGAWTRRQQRAPDCRGYRFDRLYRRHRREPHRVCYGPRGLRGSQRRIDSTQGTRSQALGKEARGGRVQQRYWYVQRQGRRQQSRSDGAQGRSVEAGAHGRPREWTRDGKRSRRGTGIRRAMRRRRGRS